MLPAVVLMLVQEFIRKSGSRCRKERPAARVIFSERTLLQGTPCLYRAAANPMKKTLLEKYRILLLCLFMGLTLTACSSPRGSDGKTKVDQIIALNETTLTKEQVNISEISDKDLKEELESSTSEEIVIEPTTWGDAWSNGWFDGLIVWPIAQLINLFASFTDAGWGIILATLLIQLLIYALTYKSQLSQQRMQELQPAMQKIQNKYAGKNDERSRMLMAQETQKLYTENDIHPFGSMLVMFIQLPVMMGMFYATMRAVTTVYGTFMGMSLAQTPLYGFQHLLWGSMAVYILMILMSLIQMEIPKWLKKYDEKKKGIKVRQEDKNAAAGMMGNTMNMTMYMTTALIAFMYISWPMAMSFYWLVSSLIRAGLSVVSHFVSSRQQEKKEAERKAARAAGILKNKRK